MHINPGPEYYTWYNFTNAILLCIGGVVSATCWWLKQLALPLMVTNAMDDDDLQQFMASVSSSRWFDSVFLVNFHGWQCKWPALSSLCGSQGHWTCWISHFKWSKMTWLLSSFRFSASQKWRRLQWKSKKSQRKKNTNKKSVQRDMDKSEYHASVGFNSVWIGPADCRQSCGTLSLPRHLAVAEQAYSTQKKPHFIKKNHVVSSI